VQAVADFRVMIAAHSAHTSGLFLDVDTRRGKVSAKVSSDEPIRPPEALASTGRHSVAVAGLGLVTGAEKRPAMSSPFYGWRTSVGVGTDVEPTPLITTCRQSPIRWSWLPLGGLTVPIRADPRGIMAGGTKDGTFDA
jgi:hypothetical protein